MKIKLDENLPEEVADLLIAAGHDVRTVPGEGLGGCADPVIFAAAVGEGRLLITQDLDFSDIRQFKPGTHPGVVLLRLRDPSRRRLIERLRRVLASEPGASRESIEAWSGCFVVISDRKLRVIQPGKP